MVSCTSVLCRCTLDTRISNGEEYQLIIKRRSNGECPSDTLRDRISNGLSWLLRMKGAIAFIAIISPMMYKSIPLNQG